MRQIDGYLTTMPAATLVHLHAPRYTNPTGIYAWREPRAPNDNRGSGFLIAHEFYTCGYCGSIHPVELAAALRLGANVHWADWKYGWPHKVYVDGAPNRYAGEMEIRSSRYAGGVNIPGPEEPARERAGGKFYTEHLQDASIEDRAVIEKAMGLRFEFSADGRSVGWKPFE